MRKHLRLAIALAACGVANVAFASASYSNLGAVNPASTTGTTAWLNANSTQYCFSGASGCAAGGGTNYGNTYTFAATSGVGPNVTLSAFGTTGSTASTTTPLQRAWIGDYGNPNGFGITSQSTGELTSSNTPAASYMADGTGYQHAIDNINAYETLLLNFNTAVTLRSVSIGFKSGDSDATIFEYTGSGDPTGNIVGKSYSDLLAAGWKIAYNLSNMVIGNNSPSQVVSNGLTLSKYWMVGAYIPLNQTGDSTADDFKVNGFVASASVPEPSSIALLGIAGAALFVGRRRRLKRAA